MTLKGFVAGVRWLVGVATAAAVVMLFTLRGATSTGGATDDSLIAEGAGIYAQHCQICHGASGQGGTGPALSGLITERFPDPATIEAIITSGGSAMPAFSTRLDDHQIEAVVAFTRYGL